MTDYPHLLAPVSLGELRLRNREVGDAAAPRDAFAALTDGHRIGREI